MEEQEKPGHSEPSMLDKNLSTTSTIVKRKSITLDADNSGKLSKDLVSQNQSGADLQALGEKVKSLMEKGQKMIPNGTQKQATLVICKVCGKEGLWKLIRNHIEANHLEGVSIPCDYCGKICPTRHSLFMHKSRFHK